jgi:hypothetical protein
MESLRHPNIVMFMGACTKLPNLAIVLEFCAKKSLWNLLQNPEYKLSWEDKRRLGLEIATGNELLACFCDPCSSQRFEKVVILLIQLEYSH